MTEERFRFIADLVKKYEDGWEHDPGYREDVIFHEIVDETPLDAYDFLEEMRGEGIEISFEELTEWAWMMARKKPKAD